MTPIDYLNHSYFKHLLSQAPLYQKVALTGLRKVYDHEVGRPFTTWVERTSDGGSKKTLDLEIQVVPKTGDIIATHPYWITDDSSIEPQRNAWVLSRQRAEELYGTEAIDTLSEHITWHRKIKPLRALQLTAKHFKHLCPSPDLFLIAVPWSAEPMKARLGDYLTSEGYSISQEDFSKTYEPMVDRRPTFY